MAKLKGASKEGASQESVQKHCEENNTQASTALAPGSDDDSLQGNQY